MSEADLDPVLAPMPRWSQLWVLLVMVAGVGLLVDLLGYHLNWIQQRDAARSSMTYRAKPTQAPGLLWLFGEPAHQAIDLKNEAFTESEIKRVFELFPEVKTINADHDDDTPTRSTIRRQRMIGRHPRIGVLDNRAPERLDCQIGKSRPEKTLRQKPRIDAQTLHG